MTTPTSCPFCEKKGLPILPLRYAVARADIPHAPKLAAPFGDGVDTIPLPEKAAHYTLRMLRSGYLYVFDERRREWTAYVVTHEDYLFGFDPRAPTPPAVHDTHFACARAGDAHVARCICVKDADRATRVWLGFSDAPWTADVLKKHGDPAWRAAHMRVFDVAAWRAGQKQAHVDNLDQVASRVAEYATEPGFIVTAINQLTARFSPQARRGARAALQTLSPWSYSPQGFSSLKPQAAELAEWADEAATPYKPAMVAIPDPAGIAMELNNLVIQRALEWAEDPRQQWPLTTAMTIETIRHAIKTSAVQRERDRRMKQIHLTMDYGLSGHPLPPTAIRNKLQAQMLAEGAITPEQARTLGHDAWSKYNDMYDEKARSAYLDDHKSQYRELERDIFKPLDRAYLAWLQSDAFTAAFTHNFDPTDIESGLAYQALIHACIRDASGRNAPGEYFQQCLRRDPSAPGAVILRGMVFNQDALVQQWNEAAAATDASSPAPWSAGGKAIYSTLHQLLGAASTGELEGAIAGMAKYFHQLSGPILSNLTRAAQTATALSLAALPEQRQLSLMQAMLHHADDGEPLILIYRYGVQTRQQAANALVDYLTIVGGEHAMRRWKQRASALPWDVAPHKTYRWAGLFVVDTVTLHRIQARHGSHAGTDATAARDAEEFDVLMRSNAGFLARHRTAIGGIGLVLSGVALGLSYRELSQAQDDERAIKSWSFGASVVAVTGEVGEMSGRLLAKTQWATDANLLAQRLSFGYWQTLADLTSGVGKLLGAVAGAIVGVTQIWEGIDAVKGGDKVFGYLSIFLGGATAALALAVVSSTLIPASLALVLFLILIAAGYVISFFRHDELQHWLDSCYFGRHLLGNEQYTSLEAQNAAYRALTRGA